MTETTEQPKTYIDLSEQIIAVNVPTDPFTENDYWKWLDEKAPDDINSIATKVAYMHERFGFVKGTHKLNERTLFTLKHIEDYWFEANLKPALKQRLEAEAQARQQEEEQKWRERFSHRH